MESRYRRQTTQSLEFQRIQGSVNFLYCQSDHFRGSRRHTGPEETGIQCSGVARPGIARDRPNSAVLSAPQICLQHFEMKEDRVSCLVNI